MPLSGTGARVPASPLQAFARCLLFRSLRVVSLRGSLAKARLVRVGQEVFLLQIMSRKASHLMAVEGLQNRVVASQQWAAWFPVLPGRAQ